MGLLKPALELVVEVGDVSDADEVATPPWTVVGRFTIRGLSSHLCSAKAGQDLSCVVTARRTGPGDGHEP